MPADAPLRAHRARLRIGFMDMATEQWTAGAIYYQNLFLALRGLEPERVPEIVLLKGEGAFSGSYKVHDRLADRHLLLPAPRPNGTFARRQLARVRRKIGWRAPDPRGALLRSEGIDAVFGCYTHFGPGFPVPLLSYVTDFQHRRKPEHYPEKELASLDRAIAQIALSANRVVVSSEDSLRDFREFHPEHAAKGRVLRFVSRLPDMAFESDPAWIVAHYDLPERFVYLPNQFWQQKNHGLVVEALHLLRDAAPEVTVVCSGNTSDYRAPLHFAKLLAKVADYKLRNRFIVLGFIPHEHIFLLMRQSLAVLQPSVFEGWSTTVEESRSMGKTILLSDIPIHREQDPPHAIFFDPADPAALARRLVEIYRSEKAGPNLRREAEARAALEVRSREYAETFLRLAAEVAGRS